MKGKKMFNVNFVANFFLAQILLPLMLDGNTRCEEFMGVYITCSRHVFTNFESTNLPIFFKIFFLFSFKTRQNSSIEIKKCIYNYLFQTEKRPFAAPLIENKKCFAKKVRRFVDAKFVKKCHKQVSKQ